MDFSAIVEAAEAVQTVAPSWYAHADVVQYLLALLVGYFIWTIKIYKEDLDRTFGGLREHIRETRIGTEREMQELYGKVEQLLIDVAKFQVSHEECKMERRIRAQEHASNKRREDAE